MLSDAIFDALHSIEKYQTEFPDAYADVADHIELVKTVMASLMGRLDDPFGDEQPRLRDLISEDQKHLWRVTCEANIARWAERLRLLGPVSAEEISSKLHDAIARQEAMLSQKCPDCGVGVGQPYEHVQDYMPNLSCPFCHEDDVDVEQGECHWEGHGLRRRLKCSECGGVWDEHYVLEELDLQPPELDGFDRKRWPQPAVGRNESADDHQPDESGSKGWAATEALHAERTGKGWCGTPRRERGTVAVLQLRPDMGSRPPGGRSVAEGLLEMSTWTGLQLGIMALGGSRPYESLLSSEEGHEHCERTFDGRSTGRSARHQRPGSASGRLLERP